MDDSLLESAIKKDDTSSNFEQKLADYCSTHDVMTWANNPLLLAWKHRSINCASEIVRLRPELACAINSDDGCTLMHTICENGDVALVKRLVEICPRLCLLTNLSHRRTPLHVAAIKGNEQLLWEIVKVLIAQLLVDHVDDQMMIPHDQMMIPMTMINLKELLNHKDCEGNTILHIATSNRQIQILKMLLSNNSIISSLVEVNATNWRGFTALDLHFQTSMADMEITSLLLQAGQGLNSSKVMKEESISLNNNNIIADENNKRMHEVMLKTVLLTVFILVAGGSYASLFNVNTIYPKEDYQKAKKIPITLKDMVMGRVHVPDLFVFMVLNTITFTGSVVVIVVNTWFVVTVWSFCFRALPLIVLGSMCVSYALLVFKIIPQFSVTIGSLQISSFWVVWLFSLPLIFFTLITWLAFKKFYKSSNNLANKQEYRGRLQI